MSGQNTCCKNKCAQLKQKNSSVRRMITNKHRPDFPGGTVDKNLPVNAGDMGSIPGLGRFRMPKSNEAHMLQIRKLVSLELCVLTREGAAVMRSPHLPRLERAHTEQRRPSATKKVRVSK